LGKGPLHRFVAALFFDQPVLGEFVDGVTGPEASQASRASYGAI
jgi:hypothetical protein